MSALARGADAVALRDHPGVPTAEIYAERFSAQGLSGLPARHPAAVAERLLAVQGQDPRGARLAVRARSEGLTAADVDRALTEERSLLITWLNRGTLHLVRSEDYPLLQLLTTPQLLTSAKRRLSQEGVLPDDADRAVGLIEKALAAEGPLTRPQLRERLDAAGMQTAGQALIHLFFLASVRGAIVRGPMVGKEHAYVLVEDWLGRATPPDRDAALAELARRYLIGHAPADDRDLARWAGIPLRDARAGLAAMAAELVEREDGLLHLAKASPQPEVPGPKLIGAYDPVLLGWTSRELIIGSHTHLVTNNGLFRPFAMVKGRAVATWKLNRGKVTIEPLARITNKASAALEADAAAVERFMSGEPAPPSA